MPSDMERIRAVLNQTATDHTPRSLRMERALEAALPVLEDVSQQHGDSHPVGCRARPGYHGKCSCEIGEAREALSSIADILEGKDAK